MKSKIIGASFFGNCMKFDWKDFKKLSGVASRFTVSNIKLKESDWFTKDSTVGLWVSSRILLCGKKKKKLELFFT